MKLNSLKECVVIEKIPIARINLQTMQAMESCLEKKQLKGGRMGRFTKLKKFFIEIIKIILNLPIFHETFITVYQVIDVGKSSLNRDRAQNLWHTLSPLTTGLLIAIETH